MREAQQIKALFQGQMFKQYFALRNSRWFTFGKIFAGDGNVSPFTPVFKSHEAVGHFGDKLAGLVM